MNDTKKIKKEKADIVLLELDPAYEKLKIGFGAAFYAHNQQLWISETPLRDPTLVSFDNVTVKENVLELDALYQKKDIHFAIKQVYEGTDTIMELIRSLHQNGVSVSKEFSDEISINLEEDGITIRLINKDKNKRAVITLSRKHGNSFLQRYPEPSMRFVLQSCNIEDYTILHVKCSGKDLHHEGDDAVTDLDYRWELDVQPEFAEAVTGLIRAGILYGLGQG